MRNSFNSFQPYSVRSTSDEHLRYLPANNVDDVDELESRKAGLAEAVVSDDS
jgi:hypothetical protein